MLQFLKWAVFKVLAEVLVFFIILGSSFVIARGIMFERKPDVAIGIVTFIIGISFYFQTKKAGKRNG